jgi:hypothetical protein
MYPFSHRCLNDNAPGYTYTLNINRRVAIWDLYRKDAHIHARRCTSIHFARNIRVAESIERCIVVVLYAHGLYNIDYFPILIFRRDVGAARATDSFFPPPPPPCVRENPFVNYRW